MLGSNSRVGGRAGEKMPWQGVFSLLGSIEVSAYSLTMGFGVRCCTEEIAQLEIGLRGPPGVWAISCFDDLF